MNKNINSLNKEIMDRIEALAEIYVSLLDNNLKMFNSEEADKFGLSVTDFSEKYLLMDKSNLNELNALLLKLKEFVSNDKIDYDSID